MDFTPEVIETTPATVTCHTEGCGNCAEPIETNIATQEAKATVRCGVCGDEMTDITRT